jgi:hypothetical protein
MKRGTFTIGSTIMKSVINEDKAKFKSIIFNL